MARDSLRALSGTQVPLIDSTRDSANAGTGQQTLGPVDIWIASFT